MNEILFAIVFDNDFVKTLKNFFGTELGKISKGIERYAVFVRPE